MEFINQDLIDQLKLGLLSVWCFGCGYFTGLKMK